MKLVLIEGLLVLANLGFVVVWLATGAPIAAFAACLAAVVCAVFLGFAIHERFLEG